MENNKLISMTEFVLKNTENDPNAIDYCNIKSYANFLSQPLTLGFFVPVDDDGNVLSEPVKPHTYASENADEYIKHYKSHVESYQTASKRVFLKGLRYSHLRQKVHFI